MFALIKCEIFIVLIIPNFCYGFDIKPDCETCEDFKICNLKFSEDILTRNFSVSDMKNSNNPSITDLVIKDQTVHYLPTHIPNFLKAITSIEITNTQLKEIPKSGFLKLYPLLVSLKISQSQIEFLEENLFEVNLILERVILDRGKIIWIASGSFNRLVNLNTLNLDGNVCIDAKKENNKNEMIFFLHEVEKRCSRNLYFIEIDNLRNEIREKFSLKLDQETGIWSLIILGATFFTFTMMIFLGTRLCCHKEKSNLNESSCESKSTENLQLRNLPNFPSVTDSVQTGLYEELPIPNRPKSSVNLNYGGVWTGVVDKIFSEVEFKPKNQVEIDENLPEYATVDPSKKRAKNLT